MLGCTPISSREGEGWLLERERVTSRDPGAIDSKPRSSRFQMGRSWIGVRLLAVYQVIESFHFDLFVDT